MRLDRCLLLLALVGCIVATPARAEDAPITFEEHVRPVLKAYCFHCHGEAGEKRSGLDVRLRWLLVEGGKSGPAIVPGEPEASVLYQRLRDGEMPPPEASSRPTSDQIEQIRRWIAAGARTARPEPTDLNELNGISPEERDYWAFQPITRPAVPQVAASDQVRNPIDAFLLGRLESHGLSFAEPADARGLIRRLYFDLTGLPPDADEVERFVADSSPTKYEELVDRLLASPQYGERWASHWLDIAGYADSEGYTDTDVVRPYAYKYRDYVIRSLNENKPLDLFIQEQLAGDELLSPPYQDLTADEQQKLIATGFLRMAPDGTGGPVDDPAVARNAVIDKTLEIVSTSLLGMTVACAQCHDHRFDPILQTDYYALRAVFEPALDWKQWRNPRQRLVSLATAEDRQRAREIDEQVAVLQEQYKAEEQQCIQMVFERELEKIPAELRELAREAFATPAQDRTEQHKQLFADYPNVNVQGGGALRLYLEIFPEGRKAAEQLDAKLGEINALRAQKPQEDFIRALTEPTDGPPVTYVFHRGDSQQPGEAVEPRLLTVLEGRLDTQLPTDDPNLPTSGRRLAFARAITSGQHPLVPRVLVNRIWLHHFGRGIVNTPGDFGKQGELPTHPELLDWLASELIDSGWDLKHLHRLMVCSTAYRQSSHRRSELEAIDPDNRWYGRMNVRRLGAEEIRDAVLKTTGALKLDLYGPPNSVELAEDGQVVITGEDDQGPARRSIYVQRRRSQPLALMEAFDAPQMEPNCTARTVSIVPGQALMLMNSQFALREARRFAERVRQQAGEDCVEQIRCLWKLALGRVPNEAEQAELVAFLQQQTEYYAQQQASAKASQPAITPEQQALANLCQIVLNMNEFLYIE